MIPGGTHAHLHLVAPLHPTGHHGRQERPGPTRRRQGRGFRRAGAEMKAFYLLMGQYDALAILEVPDDLTGARMALAIAAQGNVRLETLRAFSDADYPKLVASLP